MLTLAKALGLLLVIPAAQPCVEVVEAALPGSLEASKIRIWQDGILVMDGPAGELWMWTPAGDWEFLFRVDHALVDVLAADDGIIMLDVSGQLHHLDSNRMERVIGIVPTRPRFLGMVSIGRQVALVANDQGGVGLWGPLVSGTDLQPWHRVVDQGEWFGVHTGSPSQDCVILRGIGADGGSSRQWKVCHDGLSLAIQGGWGAGTETSRGAVGLRTLFLGDGLFGETWVDPRSGDRRFVVRNTSGSVLEEMWIGGVTTLVDAIHGRQVALVRRDHYPTILFGESRVGGLLDCLRTLLAVQSLEH